MKKILGCFSSLILMSFAQAKTVYIAPNGDDANDGLSDTAPVKTLADAYAKATEDGDTIQFLDGTYTTANFPETTVVKRGITIAGNPSDRTAVTWDMTDSEITYVLEQSGSKFVAPFVIKDISYCNSSKPALMHLVNGLITFEMANCVLRDSKVMLFPFIFPVDGCSYKFSNVKFQNLASENGSCLIAPSRTNPADSDFEFTDCQFENCGQSFNKQGGCFYNPATNARWTFARCYVSGCYASFEYPSRADLSGQGGFFYSTASSTLTVTDSVFTNNVAQGHGGVFGMFATKSETRFTDCKFLDNQSGIGNGAALYCAQTTSTNRFFACDFMRCGAVNGGAIYAATTDTLDVSNCTFKACTASTGGAITALGASIRITDSVFDSNVTSVTGDSGAAVYAKYSGTTVSYRLDFAGCVFTNNITAGLGGALLLSNVGADVEKCRFHSNTSVKGGAAYITGLGDVSFSDCLIDSCVATHENPKTRADGGGFWITKSAGSFRAERTQFLRCSAKDYGGAVYATAVTLSDFTFDACRFAGNKAGTGSAIHWQVGAGVSDLIVRNSVIEGCRTSDLGGKTAKIVSVSSVTTADARAKVENCTFADNRQGAGYVMGYSDSETLPWEIINTIFWRNVTNGNTVYGTTNNCFCTTNPIHTFANNISEQDLVNADGSVGSVNADPLFTQMGSWAEDGVTYNFDGDYTLMKRSPARDAGARLSWMTADATDIAGNARVFDSAPDLGAYEYKSISGLILIFK